jgi:predicted lipoprotein with Yx(FWY)xxD motif
MLTRTLFRGLLARDSGDRSFCSAACAAGWPPLRAPDRPVAADGVSAAKIGITARSDGAAQVTYAVSPSGNRVNGTGSASGATPSY